MTEVVLTIENKTGLHARPASVFVQKANSFQDTKIEVSAKGKTVNAKSVLMLMSLGLTKDTEIKISADGPREEEAVATLKELINSKFGEE